MANHNQTPPKFFELEFGLVNGGIAKSPASHGISAYIKGVSGQAASSSQPSRRWEAVTNHNKL